jgi:subtilisin family serine protease
VSSGSLGRGARAEPATPAGQKIKITRLDDLPRRTYTIPGTIGELLASPEQFSAFSKRLRADLESDLRAYDIEDRTTVKGYHSALMALDLIEGRNDAVLAHVARIRELEDKPSSRLTLGVQIESRIEAERETGSSERTDAFRQVYRQDLRRRLDALPWDVVQDDVQGMKAELETVSENLLLGLVKAQLEPAAAKAGGLSSELATQVAAFYWMLHGGLENREDALAVVSEVVSRNASEKPEIWSARSVDLTSTSKLSPVLIAIWDTGVDTSVFSGRVHTRPAEPADGADNDANGYVDDRHGIAYDANWNKITGLLYPLDAATRPAAELEAEFKGYFDTQAAIDSPEASALRARLAVLGQDDVKGFVEDLGHYALYCHGTHVAGIAMEGNPAASILVARLTADVRLIPDPPTLEQQRRAARAFGEVIDYFKKSGVRVVNMSWAVPRSSFEHGLAAHGIGKDAEERKAMAREMFDIGREAMLRAMKGAPGILFVGGAGNANNDVAFDEYYPPMFDLDNLLIAGAVDQAGEATSFTSFGPTVNVYSNGFEVDSFVPGGARMKLSGTSMASPNVVNLAAKLFALEPSLTPAEAARLIVDGAEVKQHGEQVLRIIDPRKSVELLRAR